MATHMARCLLFALLFLASRETLLAQTGSIAGTIVDARDGTPLEKVSVRVHDTALGTLTASDGRFQLDGVPAGRRELYVSSVDYILVRRFIDVPAGDVLVMTIPIAAGTGTYAETVNVSSASEGNETPSQQVLRSNELQQLRGVITNDPMRAIHVLPGVAGAAKFGARPNRASSKGSTCSAQSLPCANSSAPRPWPHPRNC